MNYKTKIFQWIFLLAAQIFFQFDVFAQEGGYVDRFTTAKGDTVRFYISTPADPFNLSIYKIEEEDKLITSFNNLKGGIQALPDSSYWYGCNWKHNLSVIIPDSWKPGAYRAVFPSSNGTSGVIFYVAENQPGSYSNILVVASTNTWNAYNNFGGKSIYGHNSTDGEASDKVSFLRPNWYPYGGLDFFRYERELIRWLARNDFYPEFTTDTDLHFKNDILKNYDVVFIIGHSEYWTNEHRWQFQNYLNSGGKIIILAGASCWSQVRMEDDKMVKYRPSTRDPLYGVVDSLVTTIFNKPPVSWPENELIGVSAEYGGYINHNGRYDASEGFGDYAAYNTHHWAFRNTNLSEGEEYGYENLIVGNENDGALFKWLNGIPTVTGENGTPLNFRILSMSPAEHYMPQLGIEGWAVMGIFHHPSGGAVFNASTIRWAWGLDDNPVVQQITKNVLDKFLDEKFPPDFTSWSPYIVDSAEINTRMHYMNGRDFLHKSSSINVSFSAEADNPQNETVNYFWTENGHIVSRSASFSLNRNEMYKDNNKHSVKVYAYNDKDTSTLSWNYFNIELAFSSDPVIWIKPGGKYNYQLNAFNYYKDNLKFEILDSPSWISIDERNKLTGSAPSGQDTFQVSVKVSNQHSQSDIQTFDLYVTNNVVKVDDIFPPGEYSLLQNYPNPFNPVTNIIYNLPQNHSGKVTLKIFDLLGNEISVLVDEEKSPGSYSVRFDGNELSSGIYFYRLETDNYQSVRKMMLIR